MGKLCIYLPPFASDYSGVCSVLFDLNCLTVINDASCCTGHFVYYDEPRWTKVQRPTMSTQLRSTDAVFGNDSKVVDCVLRASEQVKTDLIAVVGTPVPALTGMDMAGIACEIESAGGIPTFGFNTTGFDYYDRGIYAAGAALIDRFCGEPDGEKHGVNILGMTPLDYGDVGNDIAITEALESAGIKVNASLFFGVTTDDFARLPNAELNIAVSSAGVLLANMLKRRFGTPFIAAFPMGSAHFDKLTRRIKGADSEIPRGKGIGRLVLIGDQVMMNSLREALYLTGCHAAITNASFFCWDGKLATDGDFHIESERDLTEKLQNLGADMVICDPLVTRLPKIASLPHVELVHPAVSSRLGWKNVMQYMSAEFDAWIAETSARINEILG